MYISKTILLNNILLNILYLPSRMLDVKIQWWHKKAWYFYYDGYIIGWIRIFLKFYFIKFELGKLQISFSLEHSLIEVIGKHIYKFTKITNVWMMYHGLSIEMGV